MRVVTARLIRPGRTGLAFIVAMGLLLAACAGSSITPTASLASPGGGTLSIIVALTNDGCAPDRSSIPAGSVTFNVTNQGGDSVDEVELMLDDRIVGEREDLTPGLSGTFTVQLEPGSYVLACPGAGNPHSPLQVVADGAAQ